MRAFVSHEEISQREENFFRCKNCFLELKKNPPPSSPKKFLLTHFSAKPELPFDLCRKTLKAVQRIRWTKVKRKKEARLKSPSHQTREREKERKIMWTFEKPWPWTLLFLDLVTIFLDFYTIFYTAKRNTTGWTDQIRRDTYTNETSWREKGRRNYEGQRGMERGLKIVVEWNEC